VNDRYWMGQALALAALGEGGCRPNPMIGALIVRNGRLEGQGYHVRAGMDHAEVVALKQAGERARGATLYVNLEPCAYHGRTPPCTEAILAAGVSRVVLAMVDPNPKVSGKGIRDLKAGGVEVVDQVLSVDAEELNQPFLSRMRTGRPTVTLKAAVSADGMLSARDGCSKWITGEPARRFAHRLRFGHDAVLVGAGTVRADDPGLDVRLPLGADTVMPQVAVLAGSGPLSHEAKIFQRQENGTVTVYTSAASTQSLPEGVTVVPIPDHENGGIRLGDVLDDLGRKGVRSVLVEGGARTFASFLDAGLADYYALFQAPVILGADGGTPMVRIPAVPSPGQGWRLIPGKTIPLGVDQVVLGRVQKR
jgi:diaminohydroxyphosphoribosylaminopyrimidine deaminase/5-amino-6-(5-phosphoribosylamino)uracil reductase